MERYRAFVLQREVHDMARSGGSAAVRMSLAALVQQGRLSTRVQQAVLSVVAGLNDPGPLRELGELVEQLGFLRLDTAVQTEVAHVLDETGMRSESVTAIQQLLEVDALGALALEAQKRFVRLVAHAPACLSIVVTFVSEEGVRAFTAKEQVELARVLAGPSFPWMAPMRARRLQLAWDQRRSLLMRDLKSIPADIEGAQRGEVVRDILYRRRQEVHVLDATPTNGHCVVVLGSPADRQAIAYGRRWVTNANGQVSLRLMNPDPSVHSGWTRPARVQSCVYAGQRFQLSIWLELLLIETIERAYGIFDDLRVGKGSDSASAAPVDFGAEVLRSAARLSRRPLERFGTPTVWRGGQPLHGPKRRRPRPTADHHRH